MAPPIQPRDRLRLAQRLARTTANIIWDRLPRRGRAAFPRQRSEVTQAWLQETLKAQGHIPADATLSSLRIRPAFAERAFSSSLALMECVVQTRSADRLREQRLQLVAKFSARGPLRHRLYFTLGGHHQREARFYQQLAHSVPLRTPKPYFVGYVPATGDFCLVLERVTGIRPVTQVAGGTPREAVAALQALARFHAHFWRADASAPDNIPPWITTLMESDEHQMAPRLFARWWAAHRARDGHLFTPRVLATLDQVSVQVHQFLLREGEYPHTVAHGDFRLDNILLSAGDVITPVVIDWSAIHRGNPMMDVAYFTSMNFRSDLRRTHQSDWVMSYHEALCAAGVTGYSLARCQRDHRRYTLLAPFILISGEQYRTSDNSPHARQLAHVALERAAHAISELDHRAVLAEALGGPD